MICATCGKTNGELLVFCEDCGARLQKANNRPAAPDISFAPRAEPGGSSCPHCGVANAPGMRFCVACGRPLEVAQVPSPAAPPVAPVAEMPHAAATAQIAPAPVVDLGVKAAQPDATKPCWRCRGAVAVNAQFCRFCGAPLSEAPSNTVALAPPPQPAPIPLAQTLAVPQPIATAPQPVAAPQPIPLVTTAPITAPAAASPTPAPPIAAAPIQVPAAPIANAPAPRRLDVTLVSGPPAFDSAGSPVPAASIAAAPDPMPMSQEATREMPAASAFAIVSIAQDGGEGARHPIGAQTDIGRTEGEVQVPDDAYLAPRHARLRFSEGAVTLMDLGTANGVYLRVRKDAEVPLVDQDLILVGQQVLRFEIVRGSDEGFGGATQHGTLLFGTPAQRTTARLAQRTTEGITRDVFHVRKDEWVLGRESGDVVFTQDAFMSRRHAAVRKRGESFFLADLGSSNGTFLQIRGSVHLSRGDELRVGQQLYRLFGSEGQSGG